MAMSPALPTDPLRVYVEAAQEGDDIALGHVVRATQPAVWRLCSSLGTPGSVEDLVQETYLRAMRSLPAFRGETPVQVWLLSIARRVCADDIRKRQRVRRLVDRLARERHLRDAQIARLEQPGVADHAEHGRRRGEVVDPQLAQRLDDPRRVEAPGIGADVDAQRERRDGAVPQAVAPRGRRGAEVAVPRPQADAVEGGDHGGARRDHSRHALTPPTCHRADDQGSQPEVEQPVKVLVRAAWKPGRVTASMSQSAPIAGLDATIPASTVGALVDGNHAISVHSQDAAGNWSSVASYSWTVDVTAPSVSVSSPTTGGATNSLTPTITAAEEELTASARGMRRAGKGVFQLLDDFQDTTAEGSTAEQYALEAFERYGADAVTLSPFMGFDSVQPYLKYQGKGAFLLCRTSNPGGDDLQNQRLSSVAGAPLLYEHVAGLAQGPWNLNGQLGLVVGATYPAEIDRVRALAPTLPLLIPGVGAQGGDAIATVKAGLRANGPIIVNSSRAILYAASDTQYAGAARREANPGLVDEAAHEVVVGGRRGREAGGKGQCR